MNALVSVERNDIVTDSQIIARALSMKHNKVMHIVDNFLMDYPDLRGNQKLPKTSEWIRLEERHYRGKDFLVAVMNRECFSLLVMRFETKKAREMQRAFNQAFYSMEKALLKAQLNQTNQGWLIARHQAKEARRLETDVIKEFVDYATAQGSAKAHFYYKHITDATYKCLQLVQDKKPKLRETLDAMELSLLVAAEGVAQRSLKHHMATGEHYKVIFELVKDDIEKFANSLFIDRLAA